MYVNHALSLFVIPVPSSTHWRPMFPGSKFGHSVFFLCLLWVISLKWVHSAATCAVMSLVHPSAELHTQGPDYLLGTSTCTACKQLQVDMSDCAAFQSGPPPVPRSWWTAPLPSGPPASAVTQEPSQSPLSFQPSVLSSPLPTTLSLPV